MVQKLMWDFPQVTIRLSSMGWNTAARTESLEHCRDRNHEENADCSTNANLENGPSGYLDFGQLFLLLPVPNRQDVIVGIIHSTQECATILTGQEPVIYEQVRSSKSPGCWSSYRLGESHTRDRSVKHSHPDNVKRVEGHGVPNANVRRKRLNSRKWNRHKGFNKHVLKSKSLQTLGAWAGFTITFPSLEFPATWPVAMVTMSGCTHKLRTDNDYCFNNTLALLCNQVSHL